MTHRNFGFPGVPPSACGELWRLAAFVVIMAVATIALIRAVVFIQHSLRAWGFHV